MVTMDATVETEYSSTVVENKRSIRSESTKSSYASVVKEDVVREKLLIYNVTNTFGIGDVMRYKIRVNKRKLFEYFKITDENAYLEVIVKNRENPILRPIFIAGPYTVYTDIRPYNYDENKKYNKCNDHNGVEEVIQYTGDLKPDENFKGFLLFNCNSKIPDDKDDESTDSENYGWTVDILSQIAVTPIPKLEISLKIRIISEKSKSATHAVLRSDTFSERNKNDSSISISKLYYLMKDRGSKDLKIENIVDLNDVENTGFELQTFNTKELWNLKPKYENKPVHLVMITHGIFSNIGCDMLYIKDKIEEMTYDMDEEINPNIIVRGCMDNMGKSSNGIHNLGLSIGEYILKEVEKMNNEGYNINKISFIGHSLGGLTQSMAIHYISVVKPNFFDPKTGIKPVNFIAMASPMIGMPSDFPKYVTLALDFGALGITGRDLTLKNTPLTSRKGIAVNDDTTSGKNGHRKKLKSILEILPQPPAKSIFERFVNRTVYANIVHDGIVPLKTAALLYLDWQSLDRVKLLKKRLENSEDHDINPSAVKTSADFQDNIDEENNNAGKTGDEENSSLSNTRTNMGEIPEESHDKKAALQWLAPLGILHNSKYKSYERTQTISNGKEVDGLIELEFNPPPNASPALSALSVLTAVEPTQSYITDPSKRSDAIIHDKVYNPDELPPIHYQDRSLIKKLVYPSERVNRVQERIARAWQDTMPWRKVLVDIKPDSHNNIVVRRRFLNLFGNVAVTHMVTEHFGVEACKQYKQIN